MEVRRGADGKENGHICKVKEIDNRKAGHRSSHRM